MSTPIKQKKITLSQARQILAIVDVGLRSGAGTSMKAGEMCVEQAVASVIDGKLSDSPTCVHPVVRSFKIRLNDSGWSSNEERAKGMREMAIAQLGTNDPSFDSKLFVQVLARETIRQLVPMAMRFMLKHAKLAQWHEAIEAVCKICEATPNHAAAIAARDLARKIHAAADADAAADAAYAAAYADAAYAAYAYAAAYAAYADAAYADAAARNSILSLCAKIGVQALREAKAHGITLLDKINKVA